MKEIIKVDASAESEQTVCAKCGSYFDKNCQQCLLDAEHRQMVVSAAQQIGNRCGLWNRAGFASSPLTSVGSHMTVDLSVPLVCPMYLHELVIASREEQACTVVMLNLRVGSFGFDWSSGGGGAPVRLPISRWRIPDTRPGQQAYVSPGMQPVVTLHNPTDQNVSLWVTLFGVYADRHG